MCSPGGALVGAVGSGVGIRGGGRGGGLGLVGGWGLEVVGLGWVGVWWGWGGLRQKGG